MAQKTRPPHPHSPDELRRVSGHLWYEVAMMRDLARDIENKAPLPKHLSNARLESFLIHARALEAFFYGENRDKYPKKTDVFACHFQFRDGKPWEEHRPKTIPPALNKELFRDRANREIAHLTKERYEGIPPEKEWKNVPSIRDALDDLWERFVSNVSDKLHEDWDDQPVPSIVERDGDRSAGHAGTTGPSEL